MNKNSFSRFVTPPLTVEQRRQCYQALGLGALSFGFLEVSGELILRASRIEQGERFPVLEPEGWKESGMSIWSYERPSQIPVQSLRATPLELWEQIFPYPLSLLPRALGTGKEDRIQITPASEKEKWLDLLGVVRELEKDFCATEISCLWVRPSSHQGRGLPLLAHYVRGKCLRVGTAPHLFEIGNKFEEGRLTPEEVYSHFGTHAAFYCLSGGGTLLHNPRLSLAMRIQEMREGFENKVLFRFTPPPPPEIQL